MMEIYGAYLSYWILKPFLKMNSRYPFFSKAHWNEIFRVLVISINAGGLSIAGVGMLAVSTAALPLGLFGYHCYLIWAGMTTNESQKWADLRDDMADGCVFKGNRSALKAHYRLRKYGGRNAAHSSENQSPALNVDEMDGPSIAWPVSSEQVVVRTVDGKPPQGQEALWTQVWNLADIVNIYDLGGWDNFMEILTGR
jgi:palmitoyltransferase ZDHHC4